MKKVFILLVFPLIILSACSSKEELSASERARYKETLTLFPPDLVSHCPANIDDADVGYFDLLYPKVRLLNYIHLAIAYEKEEMEMLEKKAALEAKRVCHLTDSCLMVIPYDYEQFLAIPEDSIRNCISPDMLPIPNFRSWGLDFIPEFYEDATVYLLNAEKGRFLKDEYLSRRSVGLPEEWKHGYTKGLIFYKKYIIYWLEVW